MLWREADGAQPVLAVTEITLLCTRLKFVDTSYTGSLYRGEVQVVYCALLIHTLHIVGRPSHRSS